MCLTLEPAKLSDTILYAAETLHEGKLVHVMGYENAAENLASGPNAMLLPIPTDMHLGPGNTLDMRQAKSVLKDYRTAIHNADRRLSRGMSKGFGADSLDDDVQVFESGSYTVVLARDARDIPAAMKHLPANKRPGRMNQAIFDAYAKWYPGWPLALCAWDGSVKAEPMLWWYEPKDASRLFLPALDAHDGNPPDLSAKVDVDHTIAVGSVSAPNGHNVRFQDEVPADLRPFLATKITGHEFPEGTKLQNGDFSIPMKHVAAANGHAVTRVLPPGA